MHFTTSLNQQFLSYKYPYQMEISKNFRGGTIWAVLSFWNFCVAHANNWRTTRKVWARAAKHCPVNLGLSEVTSFGGVGRRAAALGRVAFQQLVLLAFVGSLDR